MRWSGELGVVVLAVLGCAGTPPPPTPEPPGVIYEEAAARPPRRGAEAPHADTPAAAPIPLCYRIEAPGGRDAFLFGSVHVGRDDWILHPRIEEAFGRSRILVLEVDLSQTSQAEMIQVMTELGTLPPDQRLADVVSPETWDQVQQRGEEVGLPLATVERLKPWVVSLQFIGMALLEAGIDSEHGIEQTLLTRSDSSKEIRAFETVREQFLLFDELPYDLQELMLVDALRPSQEAFANLEAVLQAWRRGDAEALEHAVFSELGARPELAPFYERTFFERNRRMSQGLEALLAEEDGIFVVVGAGHLVGEQGIPRLLERAGLRVRQVTFAP